MIEVAWKEMVYITKAKGDQYKRELTSLWTDPSISRVLWAGRLQCMVSVHYG